MIDEQFFEKQERELNMQLENCRQQQAQMKTMIQQQLAQNTEQFRQWANDIRMLRTNIVKHGFLLPFLDSFHHILTQQNGILYVDGVAGSPVKFDAGNCFEVYKLVKSRFLNSCGSLISDPVKWTDFRNRADSKRTLWEIACMFNTFSVMYQAVSNLQEQAQDRIRQDMDNKEKELTAQEQKLLHQLQQLKRQQLQTADAVESLRGETCFVHTMPQETEFVQELVLPVGYTVEKQCKLEWNLNKYNGIRLVVSAHRIEKRDPTICRAVSNVIYHFLRRYPAGATRLAMYDASKMMELDELCAALTATYPRIREMADNISIEDAILYTGKNGRGSSIANAFEEICAMMPEHSAKYPLRFNSENDDSFRPIVLFVIYGCPGSYKLKNEMVNLIGNARAYGIYLLIVEEVATDNRFSSYQNDVDHKPVSQLRDMMTLRLESEEVGDLRVEFAGEQYQLATVAEEMDVARFAENLQGSLLQQYKRPLLLERVLGEYQRGTSDFSEVLHIPVGKEKDGQTVNLSLHTGNSMAHLAMIGKTGSGKTSILQAIVLGGAYYYSPDEIEFYLVDMKQGNAFYKDGVVDYSKLKHVKMMAAGCSARDLREFIEYIVTNRMGPGKPTDIKVYNRNRAGKEKIRRTVIVIDEYTEIKDKHSEDALAKIAQQGRSYGISLVLSSQRRGSATILDHVGNYVEFKSDTVGALIERGGIAQVGSNEKMFLISRVGNCILATSESNRIKSIRAAFMDDVEQRAFIEQINAKYADYQAEAAIVIGDEKRLMESHCRAAERTSVQEDEDAQLESYLGNGRFGGRYKLSFGCDYASKLLLSGDMSRIKSLEYSLVAAAGNMQKHYLAFDGQVDDIFAKSCAVAQREEEIRHLIEDVYETYLLCREHNKKKPMLLILHNCGYAGKMLQQKEKKQNKLVMQPENHRDIVSVAAEQNDGITPEMAASLSRINQEYSGITKFVPDPSVSAHADGSPAAMLRELMEEGIRYGICIVLSCGFDGIKDEDKLLGESAYRFFRQMIAVPSLKGDAQNAQNNLLRILPPNASELKTIIESSQFEMSDRIRCYHINGVSYNQFIPFEWETEK